MLDFPQRSIVLGSQSPRRAALLEQMGFSFRQLSANADESHPPDWNGIQIAENLAERKARSLLNAISEQEVLICSDTVVWSEGQSLAKASDAKEARQMLRQLSGRQHAVITGVCLLSQQEKKLFHDQTIVQFKSLTDAEIEYYIQHYQPFDKAGAYGIQEWIGMIGIEKIEGSYFTVMGLPTHLIYEAIQAF